jgi:hypothetical protein
MIELFFILSCASTSDQISNRKEQTTSEEKQLEGCLTMADAVRYIASEKKKGVSAEKMRAHFANILSEKNNIALIDKIYGDRFDDAWVYAMNVFDECVQNIAEISPKCANRAHRCMADQFMVDVARTLKNRGIPKEKVYSLFKRRDGESSEPIIDMVYASSKDRGQLKLDIWNKCMEESF